jgi:hypothetical protein
MGQTQATGLRHKRMTLLHRSELPYHPQVVTEEDVRRVALSLPGSIERPYNRLPSFRVRSSLFLRIHELPDAFFVRSASVEEETNCSGLSRASSSSRRTTRAIRGVW